MPENGKGVGRIRALLDTDKDGRVDKSVIFQDSILEATSMLPWKGGLIVTAAPYILYLKDTNGDFHADEKEILFSGFFQDNSEAQITSLRFGIDNWIYAANNGQPGQVTFNRKPDKPALDMRGVDFRFRLDRGQFEIESGAAQFGQTMDDWGNRFITQNTLHIRQVVIPGRYLQRHQHAGSRTSMVNISDHDLEMFQETPPPYWRAERTRRRQIQYKEQNLDRVEYAEDHFTGCSGGTVYDGDAFPDEYYGNVFTGDVAGNLVHRDILVAQDSAPHFIAQRHSSEKDREFLVSSDPWFRPSGLTVGPDGYLYIVDMYRQHIETPLSIPEDLKAEMDFLRGSDRGRIYRIVPDNVAVKNKVNVNLQALPSSELIALLEHPNRWWRLQAQRLLVERHDASIVSSAQTLFGQNQDPRTRLHALYVLEGLDALNASIVSKAMEDAHAGIRKHGIILAERFPELLPQIVEHIDDDNLQVVLQVALSAGQSSDKKAVGALAKIISRHGNSSWFQTAVLSSQAGASPEILQDLIRNYSFLTADEPWKKTFLTDLSFTIGSSNEVEDINALLDILSAPSMKDKPQWQSGALSGLKNGLSRSAADASVKQMLEAVQATNVEQTRDGLQKLKALFAKTSVNN
jgi:putative membrane-bound dehydrogenase-like protein